MSQNNDTEPLKSSAEILSELFSTFNALPPILKEKVLKKHKKSKKKHKHKDKKHKKKSKHKYNSDTSDDSSEKSNKQSKKQIKEEHPSDGENLKTAASESPKYISYSPTTPSNVSDIVKTEPNDKGYVKFEIDSNMLPVNNATDNSEGSIVKSDIKDHYSNDRISEKPVESNEKESSDKSGSGKITIKSLKNSVVYEATIKEIEDIAKEKAAKFEDGEVTTESEDDVDENSPIDIEITKSLDNNPSKNDKKRKHSHKDSSKEKVRHESSKKPRREKQKKRSRSRSKDRERHSSRRDKSDYHHSSSRSYKDKESLSYDRDRYRDRYRDDKRSRDNKRSRSRENRRSRSRDRNQSKSHKDRFDYRSDRKRRSKSPSSLIDKKKLLEIARKNAINMLKSGTLPEALTLGPQAQEKVIAAIKAGGKTVEELTDFCKNLSKKEELGELSSVSSDEEEMDSNSDGEKVFHHPFQLKEKPTSIVMNIKNATPLPVRNPKENTTELRMQFPVSSGQLHRKTESEWVPVSPKKPEPVPAPLPIAPPPPVPEPKAVVVKPVPAPVPAPNPVLSILPAVTPKQAQVDISSIVSQRLNAMRKLQENPNDVQALTQMYKVQQEMQTWAASKQQIGQFTGSTGAQILTPAELSSGYQAWARKDQLQNAAPVTGGMGMHLLQKMGWKPGEGLGKEKTGSLEPLLLEVKLDKKGLVANEEVKNKKPVKVQKNAVTIKTLAGKHPVSLLGEFATKRKLGVPQYECCFECGPDHKKNFLFKVILNGIEYKPNVASSTKKQAKSDAATVCLQQLGLIIN